MDQPLTAPAGRPAVSRPQFEQGPTAVYGQLASVLRAKIRTGEWPDGHEIPTLEELSERYSVARITARQAIQILVGEGLVSSQRGRRTVVTFDAAHPQAAPLLGSLGLLQAAANLAVKVLSIEATGSVPIGSWYSENATGDFMLIRKIDCERDQPYVLCECYVPRRIYERFPEGALQQAKVARLAYDHADPPIAVGRERMRVGVAELEEAEAIGCPIAAPVVRLERLFIDRSDEIAYFGNLVYRGDYYGHDRDISEFLV